MNKKIKISDGKTEEIIIDSVKDHKVLIEIGKLCHVTLLVIERGAVDSSFQLKANMAGKKSTVNINSLVIGAGVNKSNSQIEINHLARETTSSFTGYALMQNDSEHVWAVTTIIENIAKKSVASQKINNLLLGTSGGVKNRPALIIRNNDVICSHAVATGHLDEEQLFYSQSRGLTVAQSKSLMARGFVEPFLQQLPKCVEQELGDKIDNLLDGFAQVAKPSPSDIGTHARR